MRLQDTTENTLGFAVLIIHVVCEASLSLIRYVHEQSGGFIFFDDIKMKKRTKHFLNPSLLY